MRKLGQPSYDAMAVYGVCVADIEVEATRTFYTQNQPYVASAAAAFDAATATASWVTLPRVARGNPGAIIVGSLSKEQLMALYTDHMVGGGIAARKVYDDILVAAHGLCPFCGGLGQVHTLDHYLPKANFPAYAVLPENLVPCCRDCNTGKGNVVGAHLHEQTLHPYLDEDKYFEQRWIFGAVTRTDPIGLRFECMPPIAWAAVDRLRVAQHFKSYNIASRFSVQAGAELSRVVTLRAGSLRILSPEAFQEYLLEYAESNDFDLNGWSRTTYAALAATDWFCQTDFSNPNWLLT